MLLDFRLKNHLPIILVICCVCLGGLEDKPVLCRVAECEKVAGQEKDTNKENKARERELQFRLKDTFGREVRSEDYTGVPVLIMCGSCWCGGCQQDAEPLRKIAEEYMPKGLAVIRSVSGDNELAALDFAKHYRLGFPQLMDTNREFEKRYNPDGWTFLMLADGEGKVVYKCNSPREDDWSAIGGLIGKTLKGNDANQTTIVDGIRYMNKTLKRSGEMQGAKQRDEFTSIACGSNGKVYVVFTSNRKGNSDIFVRIFDGNAWSEDVPLAAGDADEYDGSVIVDNNNQVWVSWTSNAQEGKCNIFVTTFKNLQKAVEPIQVTNSTDDAMHARMACDDKGRVWLTYYKWRKMGLLSRDKEVYVRRNEGSRWTDEIQISPIDVPEYEDHTEPTIAGYGDGAIVCWNWDFHQPKGYTKKAYNPTTFVRKVGSDLEMGRALVVSTTDIDVTPSVAVLNSGRIWCAWDSMVWEKQLKTYRKKVCVKQATVTGTGHTDGILAVSGPMVNVCTPTIAVSKEGKACIVWSETDDGNQWVLKKADYNVENNRWLEAEIVESKGNPRFCSASYDSGGKLWVAYSVQTKSGREIAIKQL
jgi:peroxiredoxin